MLPETQASMVSRMRTDAPQVHGELRTYLRTEYNGDGAAVIAAVQRARGGSWANVKARTVRSVVRTLARITETLATSLTASGGA